MVTIVWVGDEVGWRRSRWALFWVDPSPPARVRVTAPPVDPEPLPEKRRSRVPKREESSAITKDTDVASGAKTPGSMEGSRTPAISPDTKAGVGPSETEPPPLYAGRPANHYHSDHELLVDFVYIYQTSGNCEQAHARIH